MVCWSVVQYTHAGTHTHTHTQIRTHTHARSCHLSFILHLSFPLHISRQDNATLWIVRDLCVCVYVRACVCERVSQRWMKSQKPFESRQASEVVIWKADDSFTHPFMWIIAIHLSAPLYSGRIACNRGIVSVLHHSLSASVQEMAHRTFRRRLREQNLDKCKDVLAQQMGWEQCEMYQQDFWKLNIACKLESWASIVCRRGNYLLQMFLNNRCSTAFMILDPLHNLWHIYPLALCTGWGTLSGFAFSGPEQCRLKFTVLLNIT